MIQIHRRQAVSGLMASMAGFRPQAAGALPNYPTRPIRVILPFAAGGVGDTVMRVLAPPMEKKLGQKLVIDSKPGASGNIGTLEVARAGADGYTLLVATSSNFVINQFLMKMSIDPLVALSPITKIADVPLVFCSNPSVPVHDLPEFVQYARALRGQVNYGSPGNDRCASDRPLGKGVSALPDIKFVLGAGMQNVKSNSETASGRLHAARVCRRVGVGWVDEEGNIARRGDKFV
jgi:tripartite-type tricarboxylate transporter receptor subunit TctC